MPFSSYPNAPIQTPPERSNSQYFFHLDRRVITEVRADGETVTHPVRNTSGKSTLVNRILAGLECTQKDVGHGNH